jgi:subtilisin family serine protease
MFRFYIFIFLFAGYVQAEEYIVKLRPGARATALGRQAQPFQTDHGYAIVNLSETEARKLQTMSEIEWIEKNGKVTADEEPNDPDFSVQYALKNFGQKDRKEQIGTPGFDINVVPVWNLGLVGSKDILVAVVDTGIDAHHPDLVKNVFVHPLEVVNGKDDDGNGFIDDIQGWNFVDKNSQPIDGFGHGSHVAGIIGASGNDSIGITGVAWNTTILPIKALDNAGNGKVSDTVEGINYARLMKAKVINLSFGTKQNSRALEEAIEKAEQAGILVVVSAGNDGKNTDKKAYYPASFSKPNMITVAAIDNQGKPAEWTNYGKKTVQIGAPGVWIYSTVHEGKYLYAAGTSMAAPHVAGAAALLMSANRQWDFSEIRRRILSSCQPNSFLADKVSCGGHLNVFKALGN